MELVDIVKEERPPKLFARLISIYQLSGTEKKSIRDFNETRDLAVSYEKSAGKGLEGMDERKKGMNMVQESSRVFLPIISQLFLPQGFESYIPTVFHGGGLHAQLRGPKLKLSFDKEKYLEFEPTFCLESPKEGILEVESMLGLKTRDYDDYIPILADAYNRVTKGKADGRNSPRIGLSGMFLEVGEARLVRKAFDSLEEICKEHLSLERLHNLRNLRQEAYYQKRLHERETIVVKVLREGYDRLMDEYLGVK